MQQKFSIARSQGIWTKSRKIEKRRQHANARLADEMLARNIALHQTLPPHRSGRPPEGKRNYTVSLSEENVSKAKAAEGNFSALLDRLLANWLGNRAKAR